MNSTLDTTLKDVAEDTFASLAFMMPLGEEERNLFCPGQANDAPRRTARVEFSGPFTGLILLSVDAQIVQPLAANMLGLLGNCCTSEEQENDALKELLNVVCGNLLPRIATPRDVFTVHSPELLTEGIAREIGAGRAAESCINFWVDSGRVDMALFTEYPIGAGVA